MSCSHFAARLVAIVVLLGAFAIPTTAQTLRVSLDELAQAADEVVLGRTVSTESYWTPDRTAIFTRVVIRVEDNLSGESAGERIITVPGGQVGEYRHEVSDTPSFRTDEEVIVFTSRHVSGHTIVAGGIQGKMEIRRDPTTGLASVQGVAHLFATDDPDGLRASDLPEFMDETEGRRSAQLEDVLERIKGSIKGGQ